MDASPRSEIFLFDEELVDVDPKSEWRSISVVTRYTKEKLEKAAQVQKRRRTVVRTPAAVIAHMYRSDVTVRESVTPCMIVHGFNVVK